ncbi:MAG: DUF4835 family protein [Flavobacteriales bacterium]
MNDKQLELNYTEFNQLIFDEIRFSKKSMTYLIAYCVYLILRHDGRYLFKRR